jgi:putative FmdB family regulatory protein
MYVDKIWSGESMMTHPMRGDRDRERDPEYAGRAIAKKRKEDQAMPTYEYQCPGCNRKVTLRLSVAQHERGRQACPKCGHTKLTQLISSFLTQTARKA